MTNDDILVYEKLIYSVIKKYTSFYDKDDLYQAGILGLLKAHENFDENANVKFSTYAYFSILGEVKKFVREDKNIKISREYIKLNQSIDKAKEVLSQRLMRAPTTAELSLFLEIDEKKLMEVEEANQFIMSLNYENDDDEELLYNKVFTEEKAYNEDIQDLKTELSNLTDEEKKLVEERYFNDLTQSETSNKLGLSQVQVSRKETKILQKLKKGFTYYIST